jgi:hypothetical protein
LYYYYDRWYDPFTGRFVSQDPAKGDLSNPQSLNGYIYVVDRPTSLVDPNGRDPCTWWNPFTYGGCINNGIQAANNYVVQPVANFVDSNVVQPIVNNVVVPLVKNVVIPYAMAEYNGLVATYNTLTYVGKQAWNGYQTINQDFYNMRQSFDESVNQDWQAFSHDVTHLHITNPHQFLIGMMACVGTGAFIASLVLAPEAASLEVGAEEVATEGAVIDTVSATMWAHGAAETAGALLLLGGACVSLTAGSLSTQ